MADNDLQFTTEPDARITGALRALHAAPGDEAYWDSLQARVMARVTAASRGSWMQVAAGWARPGLAAAAAVLLIAAALFQLSLPDSDQVTFAVAAQSEPARPEFIYMEQDAASQREETLRLVVSH